MSDAAPAAEVDAPAAIADETAARKARRDELGLDAAAPVFALAFSGGGIRSATFCLGLLRALAKNRALSRFDYLSTVSGGGYAGAAYGRLFGPHSGADAVEAGVARDNSLFLWWLRHNGRYLIPSGIRDLLTALAGYSRGFLATHYEIATLVLLAAGVVVLPHVALNGLDPLPDWIKAAGDPWWLLLPLLVLAGIVLVFAYWFSRDRSSSTISDLLWSLISTAFAGLLGAHADGPGDWSVLLPAALLICVPLALLLRLLRMGFGVQPEQDRVSYTNWLGMVGAVTAMIALTGAADFLSWVAADALVASDTPRGNLVGGAGSLAALLALARALLPALIGKLGGPRAPPPLDRIANAAGLVLTAATVFAWLVVLQVFVFEMDAWAEHVLGPLATLNAARWAALALLLLVYVILSGRNLDQLNRASLNPFYRSRLTRTYVATGNSPLAEPAVARPRFADSPLGEALRHNTEQVRKVTDIVPGDDVALGDYQPHRHGGPIHLINCCINQTIDDRTGSFNADRKGVALTVSALGVEVGAHHPPEPNPAFTQLSLAQWVSISGAAVGSGMGSRTTPGLAALIFMTGFRLGYWLRAHRPTARGSRLLMALPKPAALLMELFARYPGLRSPMWYLSDGGHFDNTGVYALLKRRPAVIVLADCGADPNYLFADIENLVRKARIDYNAQIEFMLPPEITDDPLSRRLRPLFGTPDNVDAAPGRAYLLLARIRYDDGSRGALLVVKPRRVTELELDVAGYSDRDPGFPQQTTADQFFDEAQWESYCELGKQLGAPISAELLQRLPDWVEAAAPSAGFSSLVGAGHGGAAQAPAAADAAAPASRRERFAGTLGRSIGIGAVASVFLAAWQSWDQHSTQLLQRQTEFATQYAKVAAKIERRQQSGGYDESLRNDIDPMLVSARLVQNPPSVDETLKLLTRSMQQLCASPVTTADERAACDSYLQEIASSQQTSFRSWYARWNARYWTPDEVAPAGAVSVPLDLWGLVSAPPPPPPPVSAQSAPPSAVQSPTPQAATPLDLATRSCAAGTTDRRLVYIQIYDEERRPLAQTLTDLMRTAGVAAPGIENVSRTAARRNTVAPYAWPRASLLYRPDDAGCAEALLNYLAVSSAEFHSLLPQTRAMPASMQGEPGTMELWLPAWSGEQPPSTAICYQEEQAVDGSPRYSVHCHPSVAACESARGPNPRTRQSACSAVDLRNAPWKPQAHGWANAWWAEQPAPFGPPFPQLPPT